MARKLRYVPEKRTLISITNRTVQGRYLLRPGPVFNDIFLGILGRAQRCYGIQLFAVAVLSSHFHLLLTAEDAEKIAHFMRDLQSKLAREVNRLTGWRGPVFERRYEMAAVTEEERAQVERLRYVLSQGVKENLVERVRDWPGVHSAAALLDGKPLEGHWFDRTREYAARNQREKHDPSRFASEETVVLSPLPCWAHLTSAAYRKRVSALVDDIEQRPPWPGRDLEPPCSASRRFWLKTHSIGPPRWPTPLPRSFMPRRKQPANFSTRPTRPSSRLSERLPRRCVEVSAMRPSQPAVSHPLCRS
jgi:hypothetical protein